MQIPDKRIEQYEKLGFGLFMHWGLYSIPATGAWTRSLDKIPDEQYAQLMKQFTAENWRPREIAALAKEAGMRYCVLTTRHHEGFSLYDTRGLSTYDAPHSAAGRDLVEEFVDGCRAEGIVPFFYHTTLDWHNPDFENDFPAYLQYLRESVKILCTNYGKIGGFWFDGNWSRRDADWQEGELYKIIRQYQPEATILNNPGWTTPGVLTHPEVDIACFEQGEPKRQNRSGEGKYVAAEMCQTMGGNWSCGKYDFDYKSVPELIRMLSICRREGANYLLNVAPEGDGSFPGMARETMYKLGEWIRLYSKPFYEGRPTDIAGMGGDFALRTPDGRLYLYIMDLSGRHEEARENLAGKGVRVFSGIHEKVKSVRWMDNGENLDFFQDVNDGTFCFHATAFGRCRDTIVRVAEVILD